MQLFGPFEQSLVIDPDFGIVFDDSFSEEADDAYLMAQSDNGTAKGTPTPSSGLSTGALVAIGEDVVVARRVQKSADDRLRRSCRCRGVARCWRRVHHVCHQATT